MISKIEIVYRMLGVGLAALAIDIYTFHSIKFLVQKAKPKLFRAAFKHAFWFQSVAFLSTTLFVAVWDYFYGSKEPFNEFYELTFALFILLYLPKLFYIAFIALEDFYRLLVFLCKYTQKKTKTKLALISSKPNFNTSESITLPQNTENRISRKEFINRSALLVSSLPFAGIMHGITLGKYSFTVHEQNLYFSNLPDAFDGFKLVQISDIHSGSLHNKDAVKHAIELIAEQNPNIICFTGDLVNDCAYEMERWINDFSQLGAPNGIFSILGNHDYGEYFKWASESEKEQNFNNLIDCHRTLNWNLLRNQSHEIQIKGQSLVIAGVENWGKPPFPQYGDLKKTIENNTKDNFTILMSHDPSHWDAEILNNPSYKVPLTLSGHTHGMQFGIEIGALKWSPIEFKYPRWAGLYKENEQYLYVNRGFGTVGFPARVGIFPEITVITLNKNHS